MTYTIAPDCTGQGLPEQGVELVRFVIVDDGKGFYALSLLEGNTIYLVATRIHGRRDNDDR